MWALHRGRAPLIISFPHVGTGLLPGLAERLTDEARSLPDTDWHVDRLYAFAADHDVTLLTAKLSRYVVDLNRDPSGASLYPGQRVTELFARSTFADAPIYRSGAEPSAEEEAERLARCFRPYHDTLASELERVVDAHGYAVLLDAHSIRSRVPRFFDGQLPDLNLGTADGRSAAVNLEHAGREVLAESSLSHVVNGRFKGGYITRHYGQPSAGVHALQLELAQACYMDEGPPYSYDEARAAPLVAVLRRLITMLLRTEPKPSERAP